MSKELDHNKMDSDITDCLDVRNNSTRFQIDMIDYELLLKRCKQSELSLYIYLLTTLASLNYLLTGDRELYVYSPWHSKNHEEEDVVVINCSKHNGSGFREWLLNIKDSVIQTYRNAGNYTTTLHSLSRKTDNRTLVKATLSTLHGEAEPFLPERINAFNYTHTNSRLFCTIYFDEIYIQAHHISLLPELFIDTLKITLKEIDVDVDTITLSKLKNINFDFRSSLSKLENSVQLLPNTLFEDEMIMYECWRSIFPSVTLSSDTDFYSLGGDSIMAIQLLGQLQQKGYTLSIRDFMQNSTIALSAKHMKKLDDWIPQSEVTGEILLSPVQLRFFNEYKGNHNTYCQTVCLIRSEWDEAIVVRAFEQICEHHDYLRAIFPNKSMSFINKTTYNPFQMHCISGIDLQQKFTSKKEVIEKIMQSISIDSGPLIQVVIFKYHDANELIFIIHHLIIDGVSWRIMLEDFISIYHQLQYGLPLVLPNKTHSFSAWIEKLSELAIHPTWIREELDYWLKVAVDVSQVRYMKKNAVYAEHKIKYLLIDLNESPNIIKNQSHLFNVSIEEILLVIVSLALNEQLNWNHITFAMESHGRQNDLLDVTRTIGWFTSLYPFTVDLNNDKTFGKLLTQIQNRKKEIPNNGIGYDILRYLAYIPSDYENKINEIVPQLCFNYLGRFNTLDGIKMERLSAMQNESFAVSQYSMEIIASIYEEDTLELSISYNDNEYIDSNIENILSNIKEKIMSMDRQVSVMKNETESSKDDTASYQTCIKEYEMTPIQQNMLFHTILHKESYAYICQVSFEITGDLDLNDYEHSFEYLTNKHESLRSIFSYSNSSIPKQIVLNRNIDFYCYHNISGLTQQEQQIYINQYMKDDRENRFDLEHKPPFRTAIFKLNEEKYTGIITFHHLILDGWSLEIVFEDFIEIYSNKKWKLPHYSLESNVYQDYLTWLNRQDKEEAARYWGEKIDGYPASQALLPQKSAIHEYARTTHTCLINMESSNKLRELAHKLRVTFGNIIQAIWSAVLYHVSEKDNIAYGLVVSVRPPVIVGIEKTTGVFINTIPIRMRIEPGITIKDLALNIQHYMTQSNNYFFFPFSEIINRNFHLDHTITIENYPVYKVNDELQKKELFTVSGIKMNDHTNFDLGIIINPEPQLSFTISYNPKKYERTFISKIDGYLKQIISEACKDQDCVLTDLKLVGH